MARDKFYRVADVPVTELLLDTNNPRIRHGEDQNDCIARILRDRDNFVNLLKDVAAEGLSPEHVLVSKNAEGKWVVRDGNRRLTVLKLLNQPELAQPDQRLEQLIRRVAESANGKIPKRIECIACDDEAEIVAYLERKHTGENAGVGQRNWSALLKSLFNLQARINDPNKRAAQLVLWVEEHGLRVEDNFPLTNLNRALNSDTLQLIGFRVLNDQLVPTLPVVQAYALAARVISDVASGRVHVRRDDSEGSIYSAADQTAYFHRVRSEIGPAIDSSETVVSAESRACDGTATTPQEREEDEGCGRVVDPAPQPDAGNDPPPPTPTRRPLAPYTPSWDRPSLFPRRHPGFSLPSGHTKVANIITELRGLKVKETPLAVAMVFRTLIELSEDHYRTQHGIPDAETFVKRIARAADHMRKAGTLSDGQHQVVIRRSREDGGILHATTLHKYVHSADFHPTFQTLNSLWDELGCFVAACWR
ncbi:MAG: hypothetical protein KA733_00430 [Thauera sp.]|nr:hypothetical protein [Thauera sp.]MBP7639224.1 hypothetical protein [Thauera sp.]